MRKSNWPQVGLLASVLACTITTYSSSAARGTASTLDWHRGRQRALVVGIDRYKFLPLNTLAYGEKDGRDFAAILRKKYNFEVVELYGSQATGDAISKALAALLVKDTGQPVSSDDVIFFYSGHGQGLGKDDAASSYLIAQDCDPKALGSACISMGTIADFVRSTEVRSVLAILDTCYAGAFGAETMGIGKSIPKKWDTLSKQPARQAFTAGGPGEEVLMVPALGYSVFTKYLLDGLKGGAFEGHPDGILITTALASWVMDKVIHDPTANGTQIPRLYSDKKAPGEFIFSTDNIGPVDTSIPFPSVSLGSSTYTSTPRSTATVEVSIDAVDQVRETGFLSKDFSERTPGNNCSQHVDFQESLKPPDGFKIIRVDYKTTHIRGLGSRIAPVQESGAAATVTGVVQGDDDFLGFCREPGEVGFTIAIATERWNKETLDTFLGHGIETPSNTWIFQYPRVFPDTANHRQLVFRYVVKIHWQTPSQVVETILTDSTPSSKGITTNITPDGRLVVDASNASIDQ